ncbi:MFS sugar transporter [Penicillium cataractarum]|uniref:MFS sugar transporter n=1 Tax=Penicillium cataractarum TaxID=2100454 RepID=A0A9W9SLB1_9EURO|nr:MFS sugar transporter [Penicillium cataractarum]KAJ5380661.1 MFS sugar transporter [Penicillium cataractarum]
MADYSQFPSPTGHGMARPHLVKLNLIILSLLMYSGSQGYDGSLMNCLQTLTQWQIFMNYPVGTWLGFINALPTIGSLVFLPAQAWVSDRLGRRVSLWVGILFSIIGAGVQASAHSPGTFIVGRLFIGISTAWFAASAVLITEIAYPSHRAKCTALYNCQFYVGSVIAAWVTYGVRNMEGSWAWRIPSLLQIAIPILALSGTIFAPESPRWLVANDRSDEAQAIIAKYHAGGPLDDPRVLFEINEIKQSILTELEAMRTTTYGDMVRTKGNRRRMFITITLGVFGQWVGNGVVSFYLSLILSTVGITSVTQQTLLNGFLNVWNLFMSVGAALMVDNIGRRKLFFSSGIIMLLSYVIITALSAEFANHGTKAVGTAVIPFLFIFFGGFDIGFTPLVIAYTAEIWPFSFRARGVAICLWSTSAAGLFNIFVNPIALAAIQWRYYVIFIAVQLLWLIAVYFRYPETRAYTLEEMTIVFDGEGDKTKAVNNEIQVKEASFAHNENI